MMAAVSKPTILQQQYMNQVAEENSKRLQQLAHEAKMAREKEEEGSVDEQHQPHEEDKSYSTHENIEHRKSTAKTPGEIDEPMRVRLTRKYVEAVQALQQTALLCYQQNNRKSAFESLNHINLIALQCRELDLFKKTTNIIAHIYYQNKAYSKALQIFRKLRDAAQEDLDYVTKCFAYSMMGKCYQGIKEYSKAVICFKKQL